MDGLQDAVLEGEEGLDRFGDAHLSLGTNLAVALGQAAGLIQENLSIIYVAVVLEEQAQQALARNPELHALFLIDVGQPGPRMPCQGVDLGMNLFQGDG
jgi:hypothetical protein